MEHEQELKEETQIKYVRDDDDFEDLYANNVRFESSVWDLKLIFGQLDQRTGPEVVEQHTAIAIPWATAKIMVYYLRLNIAIHELDNGKIRVNPRVFPTVPPLPPEAQDNPLVKAAHEIAVKMRDEFVAAETR